jgi:hypothetical protein
LYAFDHTVHFFEIAVIVSQNIGRAPMRVRKTVSLQFVKRGLSSFSDLSLPPDTSSLDLTRNCLTSFEGLPSLPRLRHLTLDSNPLSSLKGAPPLPSLRWLSFRGSPLRSQPCHILMCVIVFGRQLATINNSVVHDHIRIQSDSLSSLALPRLLAGQLILSVSPLRFSAQSPDQPKPSPPSPAAICSRVVAQPNLITQTVAARFRERLVRIRGAFGTLPMTDNVPIVDFRPPDDDAHSETSFQGRRLRKVVMPKWAKTRGDYSDEGPRTEFEKDEWSSDYSRSSSTASFPPSSSS